MRGYGLAWWEIRGQAAANGHNTCINSLSQILTTDVHITEWVFLLIWAQIPSYNSQIVI
jgi:hypothetical protein